ACRLIQTSRLSNVKGRNSGKTDPTSVPSVTLHSRRCKTYKRTRPNTRARGRLSAKSAVLFSCTENYTKLTGGDVRRRGGGGSGGGGGDGGGRGGDGRGGVSWPNNNNNNNNNNSSSNRYREQPSKRQTNNNNNNNNTTTTTIQQIPIHIHTHTPHTHNAPHTAVIDMRAVQPQQLIEQVIHLTPVAATTGGPGGSVGGTVAVRAPPGTTGGPPSLVAAPGGTVGAELKYDLDMGEIMNLIKVKAHN
ncbi:hypothetical protein Pcinc_027303, partial [Petrolisthes cinctipes]